VARGDRARKQAGGVSATEHAAERNPPRAVTSTFEMAATTAPNRREINRMDGHDPTGACPRCAPRGWLLEQLGGRLDYRARDPERLSRLLALEDRDLIAALAGRYRQELLARHAALDAHELNRGSAGVEIVCRHRPHYPDILGEAPEAPRTLYVAGGAERLHALLGDPAVAIVGASQATDYGMETARGLARELAASGVTVVSGLAEGIAAAAHMGALEAGGQTVTVTAGGLDVCHPATRRALYERIRAAGCAISELPCEARLRRWSKTARTRIVIGITQMVIVVEAESEPKGLRAARLAQALGRAVGAVPGRVSSPYSRGPHELLAEGAHLVRDAQDALDALYGIGVRRAPAQPSPPEPPLQQVLEQVGAGRDTLGKLAANGTPTQATVVALAELELAGALVRGDGGRYLPRAS
jgi:DNA processing protein